MEDCNTWPVRCQTYWVNFPAGSKLRASLMPMDGVLLPHSQSIIMLYTELEAICDQQVMIASQRMFSNAVYNGPRVVVVYSMLGDAGRAAAKFLCPEFGIPFLLIPWCPENTPSITCMQQTTQSMQLFQYNTSMWLTLTQINRHRTAE